MIIVSHDANYIREHCTRAAVYRGRAASFHDLDEAFDFYLEQTALAA